MIDLLLREKLVLGQWKWKLLGPYISEGLTVYLVTWCQFPYQCGVNLHFMAGAVVKCFVAHALTTTALCRLNNYFQTFEFVKNVSTNSMATCA